MYTFFGLILALALVLRLRSRVRVLEETVEALQATVQRLRARVLEEPGAETRAASEKARAAAPPPAPAPGAGPAFSEPLSESPRVPPPVPAAAPPRPTPAPQPPPRPVPPKPVVPPAAPPPRQPVVTVSAPPPQPPSGPRFNWESLVGVRLFSVVGAIAFALAGMFFVKYSVDHGWLQPAVRMAIGLIVGTAFLVVCELKVAGRYRFQANALDAAGLLILGFTFWAAAVRWHLIPLIAAFVLLVIVTGVAVLLSIRRESLVIALLGLCGGFMIPALLSTGQDNPVGLFGYLLLLNAGLAWVAYRQRWPLLTALTLVFTTVYQWAWVYKFLNVSKLPIAAAIFLIFPIASFVALVLGRRRSTTEKGETQSSIFANAARLSAALPLVFSVYLAAVPGYGSRYAILFGFLLVLDVGLFAVALFQGPGILHLFGALSTILVMAIWLTTGSYHADAWPGILGFVAAFVLFYLAAPLVPGLALVRRRFGELAFDDLSSRAVFAAPIVLFAFPVLVGIEPRAVSPALPFGTLLALLAACSIFAVARREGAVHFLAAFFALAAEAVWSARYLTPERLLPALVLYVVFGLFYVGVPVFARVRGAPLRPKGAAGLLTLVSLGLLFFLAGGAVASASAAIWGIALLLAILNLGLFAEASAGRLPILSFVGSILSWIVLAVWWVTVTVASMLVPLLAVVGGFALLTMAGSVWAASRIPDDAEDSEREAFDGNVLLALAGHLFVGFVATQPSLSIPPWPIFAVLGVLSLGAGTAALYQRRAAVHVWSLVASAMVLLAWEWFSAIAPWPRVASIAAMALAAFAALWAALSRRTEAEPEGFDRAAAIGTLAAQFVLVLAGSLTGAPGVAFLLAANLAFTGTALGFASISMPRHEWFALGAVLPAAAAGFVWRASHPQPALWLDYLSLATPLYLLFIVYPLLLGHRAAQARAPYIASVAASVAYFFQGRVALLAGGYKWIIGALPVAQAALLTLVLAQLLRFERERAKAERSREELARLALVAGAALGFITVAIPLQLEKNWITIGWAMEGAALAWLYGRVPHKGLLLFGAALMVAVFVRLALNPAVLTYEPRSAVRVWNWYLYTYLICGAALLLAGRLLAKTDDRLTSWMPRLSSVLPAGGTILLFLLLNIEIADFYATGPTITFNFFSSTLAQDLTYTLGWALFALSLLAAGIALRTKPARFASIALLVVATIKCFLHDLMRLGGLYRVGSFVGLAICLFLVAIALQRFVLAPATPSQPSEA